MEKELPDHDAVVGEVLLEMANIFKSFFPDFFRDQLGWQVLFLQILLMYADYQDFFVIRSVEDANFSALRQPTRCPPEKIMIQLFGRGLFETGYLARLWVYSGHHMLDQAVFAGSIHGLDDQQYGPLVLSVKFFLQLTQYLGAFVQKLVGFFFGMDTTRVGRVVILETERFSVLDFERVSQLKDFLGEFHRICCIPKQTPTAKRSLTLGLHGK